jgi:hypothetical protein
MLARQCENHASTPEALTGASIHSRISAQSSGAELPAARRFAIDPHRPFCQTFAPV